MLSEESKTSSLTELSRKTGLLIRQPDLSTLNSLFSNLEGYDAQERAETLDYLKHALNEEVQDHCGIPTLRIRSWKRGSERRLS